MYTRTPFSILFNVFIVFLFFLYASSKFTLEQTTLSSQINKRRHNKIQTIDKKAEEMMKATARQWSSFVMDDALPHKDKMKKKLQNIQE